MPLFLLSLGQTSWAGDCPSGDSKKLSLEKLSQIEVTSPAKEPQPAFRVPMAIYVITGEEIRRSGATSIPEALRPSQQVPSYSTGDVRLASRFTPAIELALVGRTLLQPQHFEYLGDPGGLVGVKRNAYVKLTWTR
jgi:iron complex outermembrane receptor protein